MAWQLLVERSQVDGLQSTWDGIAEELQDELELELVGVRGERRHEMSEAF